MLKNIPNPDDGEGLEISLHFFGKWTVRFVRALVMPLYWLAGKGGLRQFSAHRYVPFSGRL